MNLKNKNLLILFITAAIIYLFSAGGSYFVFSKASSQLFNPPPDVTTSPDGKVVFDESLPKTEECPLNGAKYSKQQKSWWEKHRPLGVMIENHETSRPQSGLSSADVVYEAVAEGGITRFLAVFYCEDAPFVGPVRSARTYYLDFISEYGQNPLYAHVGGANTPGPADALSQINSYGWGSYNDLNQFSIGFPTFVRDYNRLGHATATEHTMYSSTTKLWDFAKKDRDLDDKDEDGNSWDGDFEKYSFKDDAETQDRGDVKSFHIEFWENSSDYFIDWVYDSTTNSFTRKNGGSPHIDLNTKKTITSKNVIALFMQESSANDGYENNVHLLYKTKGTCKAVILLDGKEVVGTWKKSGREGRLQILDASGNEVEFNRGPIWFEIVPVGGVADVK